MAIGKVNQLSDNGPLDLRTALTAGGVGEGAYQFAEGIANVQDSLLPVLENRHQ